MDTNHLTNDQPGHPSLHGDEHLVILFTFVCAAAAFFCAILF
ncbi:MAG TPA: hypothetical protein VFB27_05195 [Opitutaceae bacterium]|nr:hypothetical protein [Opitutaceae bacterium]